MSTAEESNAQAHELMDFQDYCRGLEKEKLIHLLMDMLWKNQTVKQSELWRAVEAKRRYDINLLPFSQKVKRRSLSLK